MGVETGVDYGVDVFLSAILCYYVLDFDLVLGCFSEFEQITKSNKRSTI